ncbi:MAG: D-alanyl-D-alanine endopeptidase [Betaproteobacteria bacterium]|nr:D-alanyl-D-alanine endopeptidase [Betaproteobacteria bacterium]
MKQAMKKAILAGALVGLTVAGPALAAGEASKSGVRKPADKAAGKPAEKLAASGARQPVARTELSKTASPAKGKQAKGATNPPRQQAAIVGETARKPLRKVSMADVDPGRLALYSASALVIDQETGRELLEKQADVVVPIASISKLMTAMVVLDAGLDANELVHISEDDVDTLKGTRSRIPVGTAMTRQTAMLLALMSSENRAANALGRHYPGGMPAFVRAMNAKARELGMRSSRFEEPTGLSSNNVSTAHDLARMVAAAANYAVIRELSTTDEATIELNGRLQQFRNTNALVRNDNWEIGVSKTGYISEAGRCLVMQARVADKPVVIVLLDSTGKMTRVGDAMRIKRWMESAGTDNGRRHA